MLQTVSLARNPRTPSALRFAALTLACLATAGTLHAQSSTTGQPNKRVATIRFGTNGSDPNSGRDPKERILQGKVQDPNGKSIKGAVVYLKDKHDSSMMSVIAGDDGSYRFAQLLQNRDYEVWAQVDKKKGVLKQISSFDDKTDITLNLKME